jgi:uncharacterized protein YdaU (DUF1376 family)
MSKRPSRLGDPLPYYKWYLRDYRADRDVQDMGHVARGIYRELIDECWDVGRIPDDVVALSRIARCPLGVMQRVWPALKPKFTPLDGMDGMFLTHAKLERQRTETDAVRVKRSLAGRANKCEQVLAHVPSSSSSSSNSKSSSSLNGTLVTQAVELPTPHTGPVRSAAEWKRLLETTEPRGGADVS